VISTSLGSPRKRNLGICNDIIRLFPDVNQVLIDLSPLNAYLDTCENRLQDLGTALQQSLVNSNPSGLDEAFPDIAALRISGLKDSRRDSGLGLEIRLLRLLLPQLHLPYLQQLGLELVSPVTPSCLSTTQPQCHFVAPYLEEIEIECPVVVQQGATSFDSCVSSVASSVPCQALRTMQPHRR
jgi:hypothetical protein